MGVLALGGAFFLGSLFGGASMWCFLLILTNQNKVVGKSDNVTFIDPKGVFGKRRQKIKPKGIDEAEMWKREQREPPQDPA